MSEKETLLRVSDATMQFGGVVAVNNLNLEVKKGEIIGLIGPNGAGKTTAFNIITGVYAPTNGEVYFDGNIIISNTPRGNMKKIYQGENLGKYDKVIEPTPDTITKRGIARTFQNIRLFKDLTVFENVLIAKHLHLKANIFSATFRMNHKEEAQMRRETMELLEILDLAENKDDIATSLPYGKQRHLEIARALATNPKLLRLDEPAAGMNPNETESLREFIIALNKSGYTIVVIEHDMKFIMNSCNRILVLNFGEKICEGGPKEVQENKMVQEAYFGHGKLMGDM